MSRVLLKLVHYYQESGTRGLVRQVARYLRDRSWSDSRWVIYERVLTGDAVQVAEPVTRRELGSRELLSVAYFKIRAFPQEITRRLQDGNVCHGFYLGDRLATIGWSSADYLELDANLRFPCPGSVGLFDFHTFEEFRARGFYTNALLQLARVMRAKGFTSAYIASDPGNLSSIKGIERAGFHRVWRITRRRRFGVTRVSRRQDSSLAIRPAPHDE